MTSPVNNIEAMDILLLKGMLDTMTDHIFILRAEGDRYKLVYCNLAMDNFMSQGNGPLCGRYLDELIPDPVLCRKISDNYASVIKSGVVSRYEEDTEGFSTPITFFETTLSPLTGEDGKTTYIGGISRNITARRNAEKALQEANAKLQQQLEENNRLRDELKEESIRDPLTNLYNRRHFMECLDRELGRAKRGQFALTLMMADLDYFKDLNDQYGHSVGDQALVEFSQRLTATLRKEDVVCRWGGEEFLIMMPGLDQADAKSRIIEWQQQNSPMKIVVANGTIELSCSIGLATAPEHGLRPDTLINAADKALYRAKAKGRNQLRTAGDSDHAENVGHC